MLKIAKSHFEDILFDNTKQVTEKKIFKKINGYRCHVTTLIINKKVVATRVISHEGTIHYLNQ